MTPLQTLVNAHGASATILPFGATLVELRVPDRDGKLANVVLGPTIRTATPDRTSSWARSAAGSRTGSATRASRSVV